MQTYLVTYGKLREVRGTILASIPAVDLSIDPNYEFLPNTRYLVVHNEHAKNEEEQPYRIITNKIHLGPRGENEWDISQLEYVRTRNNIYFKFIYLRYRENINWLSKEEYEAMQKNWDKINSRLRYASLRDGISKKTGKPWYMLKYDVFDDSDEGVKGFIEDPKYIKDPIQIKGHKIIRTNEQIDAALGYFTNLEFGTLFGIDYESHSFPMDDPEFYHMGVSIVSLDGIGAYFDMEWMDNVGNNLEYFKDKFREFLDKHYSNCIAYNVGFEIRCTYLLLHKIYLFQEGSTINTLDGLVTKRYSLKYTSMRAEYVSSWDDDFDELVDEFNELMDPDVSVYNVHTYKQSELWDSILKEYPNDIPEFERLIESYWGYPFKCIPSNILGKYCCLDSFYTVRLKQVALSRYTEKAWNCFNDNLVLGAMLNITGLFVDTDLQKKMRTQAAHITAYSELSMLKFILGYRISAFNKISIPIVPEVTKLMQAGYDPTSSKSLLMSHLSSDYESGIDEDRLRDLLSSQLVNEISDTIISNVGKIDESYSRSRKIFNIVDKLLEDHFNPVYKGIDEVESGLGYCSWTINEVKYEVNLPYNIVTEYYNIKKSFDDICYVLSNIKLTEYQDYYELPDGTRYSAYEVFDWLKNIYNFNASGNTADVSFMVRNRYYQVTNYLMSGGGWNDDEEDFNRMPNVDVPDNFTNIELLDRFEKENILPIVKLEREAKELISKYFNKIKGHEGYIYYTLDNDAVKFLYNASLLTGDPVYNQDTDEVEPRAAKDVAIWVKEIQLQLDDNYRLFLKYAGLNLLDWDSQDYIFEHWDEVDVLENTPAALYKVNFSYLASRKYSKALGTYIDGQFETYNTDATDFDENGVSECRYAGPNVKAYVPFNVCLKQSKRWSASLHTVPSQSEVKRLVKTPPGYLLSYFDISGAEVRAISYLSKDPFMMENYNKKLDPYIEFSKLSDPDKPMSYHKARRGEFKTMLLGSIYGMGIDTLASNIGKSVEEATQIHAELFGRLKNIAKMIEQKGNYCIEHNGYCESILGDVLRMDDNDSSRFGRLGINQVIQSFGAVSLAQGFMNIIRHSVVDKDIIIRPLNVVHDSSQNYFETTKLFEIYDYYHRYLSDYLYDLYEVRYEFDLEVGVNYFDVVDLKVISPTCISLEGNCDSLMKLFKKLDEDGLKYSISSIIKINKKDEEEIGTDLSKMEKKQKSSLIKEFYNYKNKYGYAVFDIDNSKYKITINKA